MFLFSGSGSVILKGKMYGMPLSISFTIEMISKSKEFKVIDAGAVV